MSKRFNIMTPRKKKDGGTHWVPIGTAWQSEKGIQLVFDALPLPDAEGRCVANLFEPRERNERPPERAATRPPSAGYADDLDDEIPF